MNHVTPRPERFNYFMNSIFMQEPYASLFSSNAFMQEPYASLFTSNVFTPSVFDKARA